MTRFGEGILSSEQLYAAHVGLVNIQGGDPEVLRELGYCVKPEDIIGDARSAAEAAQVLRRLEAPDLTQALLAGGCSAKHRMSFCKDEQVSNI